MLVPLISQHPAEPCVYCVCGLWRAIEFLGIKMQKLKNLGYKRLERPVSNGLAWVQTAKQGVKSADENESAKLAEGEISWYRKLSG